MSKQANKTVIGAFVVTAVAIAAAGVVIFGGGKFFSKRQAYVMYFAGSVTGLNIGAPVVFRGVKIGAVKDIRIYADPTTLESRIPVLIEIFRKKIHIIKGKKVNPQIAMPKLIEHGLRAQLQLQSMVTGQLQIALDYHPDSKPTLSNVATEYPEIPTIPSELEKLKATLTELPLREVFRKVSNSLTGIERIVNDPEIIETIHEAKLAVIDARKFIQKTDRHIDPIGTGLTDTIQDTRKLVRDVDKQIDPLAKNANSAIIASRKMFKQGEKTLSLEHGKPAEFTQSFISTADAFREAMVAAKPAITKAEHAIDNIRSITDKDSNDRYLINNMLKELSSAARSIRVWAEYLERHPEVLIRGKGGPRRR
jgi:paraquat-inducible protein B